MREIKFRGKSLDGWVHGHYAVVVDKLGTPVPCIFEYGATRGTPIDLETVGQYTGLKDKNGVEIYEGDVLQYKYPYDRRVRTVSKVVWSEDKACFALRDIKRLTTEDIELYRVTTENYLEIIGNICDNPELLEVE